MAADGKALYRRRLSSTRSSASTPPPARAGAFRWRRPGSLTRPAAACLARRRPNHREIAGRPASSGTTRSYRMVKLRGPGDQPAASAWFEVRLCRSGPAQLGRGLRAREHVAAGVWREVEAGVAAAGGGRGVEACKACRTDSLDCATRLLEVLVFAGAKRWPVPRKKGSGLRSHVAKSGTADRQERQIDCARGIRRPIRAEAAASPSPSNSM